MSEEPNTRVRFRPGNNIVSKRPNGPRASARGTRKERSTDNVRPLETAISATARDQEPNGPNYRSGATLIIYYLLFSFLFVYSL